MQVTVIGAGVAGLSCALELAERGASVEVLERGRSLGPQSCSWYAGGMLAPWCELESAEPLIAQLGPEGMAWWRRRFTGMASNGSLVVAHGRGTGELARFTRRTERFEWLDAEAIAALEPDLAGRFRKALLFREEGHLDPRGALLALTRQLRDLGVPICFGVEASTRVPSEGYVVDCTGLGARAALTDLRGVKGEMLLLRSREFTLHRAVRVLHPRWPLYLVPREDGLIMIGATMLESDDISRVTARSALELLSAAYALHPALGEAEIVEIGTQARPAFPDNLPRIRLRGRILYINGLYRHGFLLAPALARMAAEILLQGARYPEVMDEDSRERCMA